MMTSPSPTATADTANEVEVTKSVMDRYSNDATFRAKVMTAVKMLEERHLREDREREAKGWDRKVASRETIIEGAIYGVWAAEIVSERLDAIIAEREAEAAEKREQALANVPPVPVDQATSNQ